MGAVLASAHLIIVVTWWYDRLVIQPIDIDVTTQLPGIRLPSDKVSMSWLGAVAVVVVIAVILPPRPAALRPDYIFPIDDIRLLAAIVRIALFIPEVVIARLDPEIRRPLLRYPVSAVPQGSVNSVIWIALKGDQNRAPRLNAQTKRTTTT